MNEQKWIKSTAVVWTSSDVEITRWPGDELWLAQDLDEASGEYKQLVHLPLYELLEGLAQLLKTEVPS